MSKYSFEFKKQVVNAYLNGEGGYTYLANKFGIPSDNKVKLWVDKYNAFGDEGLKRGIFMSKYSFEFKKQVVNAYLNGEGGYTYLANKFGIPSDNKVKLWVDNYNAFGDEGLKRSRKKDFYSFEKKLSIVELYLSSEISYQDLALQEGITNPSMITN